VAVQYGASGQTLPRAGIENEIRNSRHHIGAAIMWVLAYYFNIRGQTPTPNPIPAFEEHFNALCDLLRAFGFMAGKPDGWSEAIIADWNMAIVGREADDDDLEHPLRRAFQEFKDSFTVEKNVLHDGTRGTLYITQATELLTSLQKLGIRDLQLPKSPNGLSRRLDSCRFKGFKFLKTDTPGLTALKRSGRKRPMGFLLPD
jgi:hypothetical protein